MNSFSAPTDAPLAPLCLCLIRHGETEWNAARRIQGHTDIALNAKGLRQAEAVAAHFAALMRNPDACQSAPRTARHSALHSAPRTAHFAALYSSDLIRARDTAAPVATALGLSPTLLPQLRERNYGDLEGLTYDEIRDKNPDAHAALARRLPEYTPPGGGESLAQAFARVHEFLATLPARHAGGTVIVVTHGGVIDLINRFVRQRPLDAPRDYPVLNAALNWLRHETDSRAEGSPAWRIECWAETGHLPETARDELRDSQTK